MTVLVLSALVPGASADNGVRLTINDSLPRFLSAGDVDGPRDVPIFTPGRLRASDGSESTKADAGGTSVAKVAEIAGLTWQLVESMTIRGAPSGDVTLSQSEIHEGFPGGGFATIYTGYGHGVRFFRPLRGDSDANDQDTFGTVGDGDLEVALKTTNTTPRTVVATAGTLSPEPSAQTTFGAHVDGAPPGVTFSYSWNWDDGSWGAGATPTHGFAAGHYRVTATATGSDGSVGVSQPPLEIQVAAPAGPAPTAAATATPAASGAPAKGQGPGGVGAGGGAPTGGGEGDQNDRATGPARSKGRGDRRTARSKPEPEPAAAAPTVEPAATVTATPTPQATPQPPIAAPEPETRPGIQPAPGPGGEPVEGILLADSGSIADVVAAARSAAADDERSQARRGGGGGSVPGWIGGSGLLLGLLAAGAVREGGLRLR